MDSNIVLTSLAENKKILLCIGVFIIIITCVIIYLKTTKSKKIEDFDCPCKKNKKNKKNNKKNKKNKNDSDDTDDMDE